MGSTDMEAPPEPPALEDVKPAGVGADERPDAAPGGKTFLVAFVWLGVLVLDQATKLWIDASMDLYQSTPIVEGFFNLTYLRNSGAAFSMLSDLSESIRIPFFVAVAVVAVISVLYFIRETPASDRLTILAFALVLGGATGNLVDRVAYGEVIDFLDVYWGNWHWPAFNVADSGISVGVVLLLFRSFFPPAE